LPLTIRRNMLPIFKEALNNIVKHARATEVEITVEGKAHLFRLSIRDNGAGFDEDRVRKGNGIKNLHRRAAEMNSKLQILSQPGHGTTVSLEVGITWMLENAGGTK
jgi:signal transduction histidine kinase